MSKPATPEPAAIRLRAIAEPMMPMPMTPTFMMLPPPPAAGAGTAAQRVLIALAPLSMATTTRLTTARKSSPTRLW